MTIERKRAVGTGGFPYIDDLAASKLPENKRDGFSVYLFEAEAGGVLLTGNYPTRVKSRGRSKGRIDWNSGGPGVRVMVSDAEYREAVDLRKQQEAAA